MVITSDMPLVLGTHFRDWYKGSPVVSYLTNIVDALRHSATGNVCSAASHLSYEPRTSSRNGHVAVRP